MVGLARAAVNGDEKALDLFSSAKGKKQSSNQFANSFFFGTSDGKEYKRLFVEVTLKVG